MGSPVGLPRLALGLAVAKGASNSLLSGPEAGHGPQEHLLGELQEKGYSGNGIMRKMSADDGKHWEAPRVWSRRDSLQASRDVNTKHTQGCQRRWDEMKNAGSVPGPQWHGVFGSSRGSGGGRGTLGGLGGAGECALGHPDPPAFTALLGGFSINPPSRAVNAGGEDPCRVSCQRADSAAGSLRNVAAASSRAGPRLLLLDNSQTGASPHCPGHFSTRCPPDTPGCWDLNPSLDVSSLPPSSPPVPPACLVCIRCSSEY